MNAPVALFVYNRLIHTQRVLEALNNCVGAESTELYIFSDGAKKGEDQKRVNHVREFVTKFPFKGKMKVIESNVNMGLYSSITQGINRVFETYDSVIVLEDDLVVHPEFLVFMQHYLNIYSQFDNVIQISGYLFANLDVRIPEPFLMNLSTTWGWATWKEKWNRVDLGKCSPIDRIWLYFNKKGFNLDNGYDYYAMLNKNRRKQIQSWGVEFWYHTFRTRSLVLYPPYSLVSNIGFDNSGTHSGSRITVATEKRIGNLLVTTEKIQRQDHILHNISKKLKNNEAIFV